jgi:predicted DNA binding CopG/RHH family protein
MQQEYDLSKMQSRPNPFAKQLKRQVTLPLANEVIEYFEAIAQEQGIAYEQLIHLYLQDCVTHKRQLPV